ncbi:hypothetical protein SVIO_029680 [Streptomyces violaceusniger]|uniref:NADP-dependent oxidoreductase domain-containing protein n=1 Tax=Streptomyces violaceusniger TaxID=68280 RepID=A0A4D4KTR9_STRVO|nr:hypothetical protein SVIO_029680 [Streptomyces violaceusniger]
MSVDGGRAPSGPRELGRSGVRVPPLGLGCAPLANLYEAVPEERALDTVRAAFDTGLTYMDTAPHYGVGLSEERLGRVLAGRHRAGYTLSTKVGRRLRPRAPGSPSRRTGSPTPPTGSASGTSPGTASARASSPPWSGSGSTPWTSSTSTIRKTTSARSMRRASRRWPS